MKLAAVWDERRRILPDTSHYGLLSILERTTISEDDLIVLLSADISLFRSADAILEEARKLATESGVPGFSDDDSRALLANPRVKLMQMANDRIAGFSRCPYEAVNGWADKLRIDRRIQLARLLVLFAVPQAEWSPPQKQQYISQILDFFAKKVAISVLRGPLVRMSIGKTTARVDLCELGTDRVPAASLLDNLLQRNQRSTPIDPAAFLTPGTTEGCLSRSRHRPVFESSSVPCHCLSSSSPPVRRFYRGDNYSDTGGLSAGTTHIQPTCGNLPRFAVASA